MKLKIGASLKGSCTVYQAEVHEMEICLREVIAEGIIIA